MDRFANSAGPGRGPGRRLVPEGTLRGVAPVAARAFALSAAALLAACGNTGSGTANSGGAGYSGPKPVSLVKSFGAQDAAIQKLPLNSGAIAKAVERYRINKKAEPSPYQKVGVDLNGDGQAEALVFLSGEKWCAKTGCTLTIFRSGQFGYRAVSTIRRVKPPIRVTSGETQGWRNIIVNTGGVAGLPIQTVLLQFTGRGYPGNATTIAPIPAGQPVGGTILIDAMPVVPPAPATDALQGDATPQPGPPRRQLSLNP